MNQGSHPGSLWGEVKPRTDGLMQAVGRLFPGLEKQQWTLSRAQAESNHSEFTLIVFLWSIKACWIWDNYSVCSYSAMHGGSCHLLAKPGADVYPVGSPQVPARCVLQPRCSLRSREGKAMYLQENSLGCKSLCKAGCCSEVARAREPPQRTALHGSQGEPAGVVRCSLPARTGIACVSGWRGYSSWQGIFIPNSYWKIYRVKVSP